MTPEQYREHRAKMMLLALHRSEVQQEQAKSKAHYEAKQEGPPDTTNEWYREGKLADWKKKIPEYMKGPSKKEIHQQNEAVKKDRKDRGENGR